jgi:hypothetical protein
MDYQKYLKYKNKYLELKNKINMQKGGNEEYVVVTPGELRSNIGKEYYHKTKDSAGNDVYTKGILTITYESADNGVIHIFHIGGNQVSFRNIYKVKV